MNKYPYYYAIYQNGQYLANACSTDWDELDPYGAGEVVEVSKALYDYLLKKSSQVPSDQTIWISTDDYKPESFTIPYTNLELDEEKVKAFDQHWKELQKEYPNEFTKDSPSRTTFTPWKLINSENFSNLILEEDDSSLDITGLYLTGLNDHHYIEKLTTSKDVDEYQFMSEGFYPFHGVSDNATQVKRYLQKQIDTYLYQNDVTGDQGFYEGKRLVNFIQMHPNYQFVIFFSPFINDHTNGFETQGWRWHKWGEYIGKHIPCYEYLSDEKGIDYVLTWKLAIVEDDPSAQHQ